MNLVSIGGRQWPPSSLTRTSGHRWRAATEDGSRATSAPHYTAVGRLTAAGSAAAPVRVCPPRGRRASRVFQVCVCLCTRARTRRRPSSHYRSFSTRKRRATASTASTARTTTRRGAPGGPLFRLVASVIRALVNCTLIRHSFDYVLTIFFFLFV